MLLVARAIVQSIKQAKLASDAGTGSFPAHEAFFLQHDDHNSKGSQAHMNLHCSCTSLTMLTTYV